MEVVRVARVLVGLGSNLGSRRAWLRLALVGLRELNGGVPLRCSPLYRSPPMGPPQPDYLNAVVALHWEGTPEALLGALQGLEGRLLRRRARRWGPRTVDLDLLWMERTERAGATLTVPHPGWLRRPFTVVPALSVAPRPARAPLRRALQALPAEAVAALRPVRWVEAERAPRGQRPAGAAASLTRHLPGPDRWAVVVGRDVRDCAQQARRRGGRLLAWAPAPDGGVEGVYARLRALRGEGPCSPARRLARSPHGRSASSKL